MKKLMIVHRLMLKELFLNFLMITLFLNIIFFIQRFINLTRLTFIKGADLYDIFLIFIYMQPSIMLLTLPMAFIIAIFLVYGRMLTDNELVVLRISGMSLWYISQPVVLIASIGCLLSLLFSLYVSPVGLQAFRQTFYKVIANKAALIFEEGTFSTTFKDTVIFVNRKTSETKMQGVFINKRSKGQNPIIIVAKEAVFEPRPSEGVILVSLMDGILHSTGKGSSTNGAFKKYTIWLASQTDEDDSERLEEYSIIDLLEKIDKTPYKLEFHKRFAIPFMCFIFAFLAPAMSLKLGKTGKLGGLSISIFIVVLYYLLLIIGGSLATSGKFPVLLSAWGPNLFFGSIAMFLFIKAQFEGGLGVR